MCVHNRHYILHSGWRLGCFTWTNKFMVHESWTITYYPLHTIRMALIRPQNIKNRQQLSNSNRTAFSYIVYLFGLNMCQITYLISFGQWSLLWDTSLLFILWISLSFLGFCDNLTNWRYWIFMNIHLMTLPVDKIHWAKIVFTNFIESHRMHFISIVHLYSGLLNAKSGFNAKSLVM